MINLRNIAFVVCCTLTVTIASAQGEALPDTEPEITPTYSLRRTYDNEELTSTLNGKTYKLSDGYYFFNQLHPQWAVALPWAIPFCYDIDDPGATRSETIGMTWWNGPSTSIAEPVQVGSNTATDGNGMPIVGTTGKPGNSCMASNMVFHPELWCHGQKKDSRYLSRESGRNVIKTIYDPCPPHFTVPPARAMSFLISSSSLKDSILSQYMQLSLTSASVIPSIRTMMRRCAVLRMTITRCRYQPCRSSRLLPAKAPGIRNPISTACRI